MDLKQLKPKKALNTAYLKVKPHRNEIERFKSNLTSLLDRINDSRNEYEEFHKNLVGDFLKNTYYTPDYFINTKADNDLVIHNGKNAKTHVGVIIEAKSPTNKYEMISTENLNRKAFQELVLYYLRERITHKNLEIKHLVATNINEWFIFDAKTFDRIFAQNKKFVRQFIDFENDRLAETRTDFFYNEIAAPFIEDITKEIEFTHFNFQDYQEPLRNESKKDDNKLIALFKLLSPEHLLKLPFANDSNSLDKSFYSELLHIIGLTERKKGSKKIIERYPESKRSAGSLIENAIIEIDSHSILSQLNNPKQYGKDRQERLFNIAMQHCIIWINRILFLKLLEAQLLSYHNGNKEYAFLNIDRITGFDDLDTLFFQVLARQKDERNIAVKKAFEKVPYLNSSLFEPQKIEHKGLFIGNLDDDKSISIYSKTVLKNNNGKREKGKLKPLPYLFKFLNAFDFSSEGKEEIQEENKNLINASVLGLIFEKINGYKDGSFFTPGFVTMYMSRETIRKSVVHKFNEAAKKHTSNSGQERHTPNPSQEGNKRHTPNPFQEGHTPNPSQEGSRGDETNPSLRKVPEGRKVFEAQNAPEEPRFKDLTDVYNAIGRRGVFSIDEANQIINSLKICDPAVGSGHFLVSALNEIIATKNDLRILQDSDGMRLKEYEVQVVNDELIITDEDGEIFEYKTSHKESQRIQETLFHEKQTIIENCLFGVDINPNSVKICRLRLWIELLKNAYYKNPVVVETHGRVSLQQPDLQTLPNIDINIKCGNSLISRFDLKADLKNALKDSRWNIDSYQIAVDSYRNAKNKEQKREMEQLIADIKSDFRSEISQNDPKEKTEQMERRAV